MYQNIEKSRQFRPDSSRRPSEPFKAIPMTSSIISRQKRREKLKRRRRSAAAIMILLTILTAWSIKTINDQIPTAGRPPVDQITTARQPAFIPAAISEPTATPVMIPDNVATSARYEITTEERGLLESVVTAEAVGEPFAGQVAVAQCILNACEKDGIRPLEALTKYKYAKNRPEPAGTVPEAVAAVFDDGWYVTTEPILYFYAPDRVTSNWHESQDFVIEINGHRFFTEKSN